MSYGGSEADTGTKESHMARLVQALVLSTISNLSPYVTMSTTEHDKLDVLIRKPMKQTLVLPMRVSTDTLLRIWLCNAVKEVVDTHSPNQKTRLVHKQTSRKVLMKLKWVPRDQPQPRTFPEVCCQHVTAQPIVRNKHPNQ